MQKEYGWFIGAVFVLLDSYAKPTQENHYPKDVSDSNLNTVVMLSPLMKMMSKRLVMMFRCHVVTLEM